MAEVVVALDFPERDPALDLARLLKNRLTWVKVGLELYTACGPSVVAELKDMGYRVFVDLKIFDIPNTAESAAAALARRGADMITAHLTGGQDMIRACARGIASQNRKPLLVGVTVLTSMPDTAHGREESGVEKTVVNLALSGKQWGADGVVCSARESFNVKQACGPGFICVTPGIRIGSSRDDQNRTATPEQAVKAGADFLVIGRPITRAADPVQALAAIQENMAGQAAGKED